MSTIRAVSRLTRTQPSSPLQARSHSQLTRNFRHSARTTAPAVQTPIIRRHCLTTYTPISSSQSSTASVARRQLHTTHVPSAASASPAAHSSLSPGVSNKEQPTTIPKVADHSLTSDKHTTTPTDRAAAKAVSAAQPAAHAPTTPTGQSPSTQTTIANMSATTSSATHTSATTETDLLPTELPKNSFAYYKEVAIICLVFAITGSTAVYIIKPLIPMLTGINGSLFKGPISYQLLYVLCLTPSYSVMLFIFSRLFGRKRFFNAMLTRMWGRFIGKRNAQKLFGTPTTQIKPAVTAAAQKQQ